MSDPIEVLDFWLRELEPPQWFEVSEALDDTVSTRFGELWEALRDGGLEHWVEGTVGSLAYLIVADQFPRNLFRGRPEAFSTDALALQAARKAIDEGWDMNAPQPERQFFYMPFEHSENLEDQALAVRLMEERLPEFPDLAVHARAHEAQIRRFGRFPGRNAALGRDSTAEEADFLENGGYATLVRAMIEASHAGNA